MDSEPESDPHSNPQWIQICSDILDWVRFCLKGMLIQNTSGQRGSEEPCLVRQAEQEEVEEADSQAHQVTPPA